MHKNLYTKCIFLSGFPDFGTKIRQNFAEMETLPIAKIEIDDNIE